MQSVDIVYLFCHSRQGDEEIRYSLRSVAANLDCIRKVWIFGNRPQWLTDDRSLVEHVPHGYIAPLFGYQEPVRNDFLMLFLASLIPGVQFDFLRFSDDYIVLSPMTREQLCTVRALENLDGISVRGQSAWKDQLWRTYDLLKHYGYPGVNFDAHVPHYYTRTWVFEAFMAFRDFLPEERYGGMVSETAIYNYAVRRHGLKYVWSHTDPIRTGFYGSCPEFPAAIAAACGSLPFLSFDDPGFGPAMQQFLADRFPAKCKYER